MTRNFRVGDMVRNIDFPWHVGKVVELESGNLTIEKNNGVLILGIADDYELVKDDSPTEAVHTPINYKNEYHRLLEDNQRLDRQLCDAYASKETIHSFYRDDFYLKDRIIAFLFTVVAVETIILMWGSL